MILALTFFGVPNQSVQAQSRTITVSYPAAHQVFQRRFEVPQLSQSNHPGGAAKGYADVRFGLEWDKQDRQRVEYRLRSQSNEGSWKEVAARRVDGRPDGEEGDSKTITEVIVGVPAGGWYHADFRISVDGVMVGQANSEPFGVGELFLIAGQSYATNCNDERLEVTDPDRRVVALDLVSRRWRIANDPQPAGDSSDGGSIWPPFGDLIAQCYDVPVGMVNVAVGGTSTSQWRPEGDLYERLIRAGKLLEDFRAVLWQQGESDVIEKTSTSVYVERLIDFRSKADQAWGRPKPWFLAKSTLHPTVYTDPIGEANIRQAIETLIEKHRFERGPDTDRLAGANRGPLQSRRHFSGQGQRNAAAMWFACIAKQLDEPKPPFLQHVQKLEGMHLHQPAWKSPIIYHESSVLFDGAQGTVEGRLAFPAKEVFQVRSALGFEDYKEGTHWRLDATGSIIEWLVDTSVSPIAKDQLYLPAGSPNSYKHRVGKPEENLLYAPGKWFHERNIEITYRRADVDSMVVAKRPKLLERFLKKLQQKDNVVIAVSGDSISTGLDASATTATPPNQPGYPDLFAAQLTKDFGGPVQLVNRSVAGWSIANGVEDLGNVLESKPDLLIVAYGMNDVGRRDPAWFAQQARDIQRRAKERLPEIEILWIAPMLGNREWIHTPRDMFFAYRDALQGVAGDSDTLVDLTEVWEILLQRKHDLDLTGNGLNHPNDFGHRLYAQAILEACTVENR
jgi:lysophospholipase L1-like esterase